MGLKVIKIEVFEYWQWLKVDNMPLKKYLEK